MAESRSHPFRGFLDMMSEMDRMRNLGRSGIESGQPAGPRSQAAAWVPTIDVVGRGRDLVISAEIPGVAPKDIDINVSNGVLTVSGERPAEPDAGTVTPYVRERYYGHFRRSMALPDGVDERKISASFDNGVVKIAVPDAADTVAAPTPHHIPIAEG